MKRTVTLHDSKIASQYTAGEHGRPSRGMLSRSILSHSMTVLYVIQREATPRYARRCAVPWYSGMPLRCPAKRPSAKGPKARQRPQCRGVVRKRPELQRTECGRWVVGVLSIPSLIGEQKRSSVLLWPHKRSRSLAQTSDPRREDPHLLRRGARLIVSRLLHTLRQQHSSEDGTEIAHRPLAHPQKVRILSSWIRGLSE